MESLIAEFTALSSRVARCESSLNRGIIDLERVAFEAAERGRSLVSDADDCLAAIDALVDAALSSPYASSDDVRAFLVQCLVSFRPRVEAMQAQLSSLLLSPPSAPLHRIADPSSAATSSAEA